MPTRGAGSTVSDVKIPLSDLDYGHEEEEAVLRILRSKWLSTGPEVKRFEQEIAALIGVRHAVAVANGTAALHLALLALGIGRGDEVIQPAVNFVAAANITCAVGATPVTSNGSNDGAVMAAIGGALLLVGAIGYPGFRRWRLRRQAATRRAIVPQEIQP